MICALAVEATMLARWNERPRLHPRGPGAYWGQQPRQELQYGGDSKTVSCLADLLMEMREGTRGESSELSPCYEHHDDGVEKSSLARVA